MHDAVRSCLGVSERVWDCLFQVLDRWHPTSRERPVYAVSTIASRRALHARRCISVAARRGKHRAMIAVAHALMHSAFSMLSRQEPYRA